MKIFVWLVASLMLDCYAMNSSSVSPLVSFMSHSIVSRQLLPPISSFIHPYPSDVNSDNSTETIFQFNHSSTFVPEDVMFPESYDKHHSLLLQVLLKCGFKHWNLLVRNAILTCFPNGVDGVSKHQLKRINLGALNNFVIRNKWLICSKCSEECPFSEHNISNNQLSDKLLESVLKGTEENNLVLQHCILFIISKTPVTLESLRDLFFSKTNSLKRKQKRE